MPKALFSIHLRALDEPGANGAERGEFLLAPNPGEDFGYKPILGTAPLPSLTMQQLKRVPPIVVGGSAALMAIWWITNRRDEVRANGGKRA